MQLVRTILASCVRFDVVPRLLIGAQRSIELQASGVGLFTPYRQPLTFHRSLPLSVDYLLLFLVTSQPSTLCLLVSLFRYLRYIYNVYVCVCVCIYIYIHTYRYFSLSRSVAVARTALSEFHFRPITIHPRFKAAVTLRSSVTRCRQKRTFVTLVLVITVTLLAHYFSMTNARLLPLDSKERSSPPLMAACRFEDHD